MKLILVSLFLFHVSASPIPNKFGLPMYRGRFHGRGLFRRQLESTQKTLEGPETFTPDQEVSNVDEDDDPVPILLSPGIHRTILERHSRANIKGGKNGLNIVPPHWKQPLIDVRENPLGGGHTPVADAIRKNRDKLLHKVTKGVEAISEGGRSGAEGLGEGMWSTA